MKCKVQTQGDTVLVVLEGEITIQNIATLRETLLTSIADHASIVVDVNAVTRADLSFLQVLCAAHRHATVLGRPLSLRGGGAECISGVAAQAGYLRTNSCELDATDTCLWTTGGKT